MQKKVLFILCMQHSMKQGFGPQYGQRRYSQSKYRRLIKEWELLWEIDYKRGLEYERGVYTN